jgi:hypothetical protein
VSVEDTLLAANWERDPWLMALHGLTRCGRTPLELLWLVVELESGRWIALPRDTYVDQLQRAERRGAARAHKRNRREAAA